MSQALAVRLGMDLATGTTRPGDPFTRDGRRPLSPGLRAVSNDARTDHFISRDGKLFAGTHLIIEVVDGEGLDDETRVRAALNECVEACGATLLHIHTHKFSPQGVSGVAVLAESHISVHTWPEIGYGAFDVFMCGEARPWEAVEVLRRAFAAGEVQVRELLRGEDVVAARL